MGGRSDGRCDEPSFVPIWKLLRWEIPIAECSNYALCTKSNAVLRWNMAQNAQDLPGKSLSLCIAPPLTTQVSCTGTHIRLEAQHVKPSAVDEHSPAYVLYISDFRRQDTESSKFSNTECPNRAVSGKITFEAAIKVLLLYGHKPWWPASPLFRLC